MIAEPEELQPGGTPAPPTRRRRLIALIVVLGVIVVLAIAGIAWWNQRGPSRPSIGNAIDRFRSNGSTPSGASAMQPRPGVYIYAGQGEESLSFLATHQSQDGNLPGTVTRDAHGCWSLTVEYNSFHRQSWHRCAVDGRLVDHGNTTDQKFDFGALSQSEHTEVVCDPAFTLYDPAFSPGHRETVRCVGNSQTTKARMNQRGRMKFIGPTTVVVAKRRVPALHYAEDVTISGDQTGSSHEELWIAAADGLPLREERTISVVSPAPAPLNHVTYSEHGTWTLTSLSPHG
ncbi:MAG: hypothetical protein ACXVKA_16380 [Acidimicrobiia bacterium]